MSQCVEHPGRDGVMSYGRNYYCAKCRDQIIHIARPSVGGDIDPRDCFVVYIGGDQWEKIEGTGCAHWVAHEREIRRGRADTQCLLGYTLRIEDLIAGLSTRTLDARRNIHVNDIYVTANGQHCGLVVQVEESRVPGGKRKISIRNDHSNHSGTGKGVVTDDFDEHFHGTGVFKW